MLVYGDGVRRLTVAEATREVADALAPATEAEGLARHTALAGALIAAGELWQGLADADSRTEASPSAEQESAAALTLALARALIASWRSGFAAGTPPDPPRSGSRRAVELRRPEGYAFYALYPESYAEAALHAGLSADTRVLGVRSIGTSLSAVVAATLEAAAPLTVRPTGHPFARTVEPPPELTAAVAASPNAAWAIVDEGPGLSGSSFGAAADTLEAEGVARSHIHFFPSHAGDLGPQASESHRERWRAADRPYVAPDALLALDGEPAGRLRAWIETLIGPTTGPLEDVSGGAWRERVFASEGHWPPVNAWQERRKFIARTAGGVWLAKFVGLGRYGEAALTRARALHAAGAGLEAAGLAYGFLVRRWRDDLSPLERRPDDLRSVADVLAARAALPAGDADGASPSDLLVMARRNTELGLGPDAVAAWDRWADAPERLGPRMRRVQTDNRLQPWEWLQDPDGRLFKVDETDHCAAHDLIGCQDLAWDVAGAVSEFELDVAEAETLRRHVGRRAGREIDADLLAFLLPVYEAFQLGWWTLARDAHGGWPAEQERLAARAYVHRLRLARRLSAL